MWPLETHIKKSKITPDSILLSYYPNTAGQFILRILSCSRSLDGDAHYEFLLQNYNYKNNFEKSWKYFENVYNPIFVSSHPRYFNFDDYLDFSNMIYIDYKNTDIEKKFVNLRKNYTVTSTDNPDLADLQYKYQVELFKFLQRNNKKYYNFPFIDVLNKKQFALEINNVLLHFNLEPIEYEKIINVYNRWFRLNLNLAIKSIGKKYDKHMKACDFE